MTREAKELIEYLQRQMPKEGYALTISPTKYVGIMISIMDEQEKRISELENKLKSMETEDAR